MAFKHSILAFTLATVSGFALNAQAAAPEPATSFHPTKAWGVAGDTGSLCTVQSVYNNGFIVGFNGAAQQLRALDINFRQNIFESGKNYDVNFTIPGQAPQKLSAKATAASALSINMRGNNEALKNLRTASAFDIDVEGNEFRFYLSGLAAAAQPFEQCIGIANAALSPAAPQKPAEPKTALVRPQEDNSLPVRKTGLAMPPSFHNPAMVNESIAFEEAEKMGKSGDVAPLAVTSIDATTKEVQAEPLLDVKPLVQTATPEKPLDTSSFTRRRMSEKLAKEIVADPSLVAIENTPPELKAQQLKPEEKQAEVVPAPVLQEKIVQKTPLVVAEDVVENEAPIVEEPVFKPAPQVVPPPIKKPPQVVSRSTPPMVVHREKKQGGTVDLTSYGADDIEPASNENFAGADLPKGNSSRKADPDMLRKISELESMVRDLKKENADLNADLKSSFSEAKQEQGSISSENWNLERATMRYTEAERELKRMGQRLQQERAQCGIEKQELEAQLFDPQLTSQEQLARLADLEQQLSDAKAQLQSRGATQ